MNQPENEKLQPEVLSDSETWAPPELQKLPVVETAQLNKLIDSEELHES